MMFSSLWCHSMLTIPCFCLLWTRHCLCSDLDGHPSSDPGYQQCRINTSKNQQRHLRHDRGSFLHSGIVIDRRRTPQRWYLRSFLPVAAPNPCKLQHFLPFLNRCFCLDERKKRWYLRVFQKIEDRDVNETL